MRNAKRSKGVPQSITLPGRSHPYLLVLMLLSLAVAGTTAALLATASLPIYAWPPLGAVVATSGVMAMLTLRHMGETTINFGPSALEVNNASGTAAYPWGKIAAVRVIGATGSISDDPMTPPEKRIGLAVFLKTGKDDDDRSDAGQADFIIAAGTQDADGDQFVSISQSITKAIRSRQRQTASRPAGEANAGRRRIGIKPQAA